MGTTAAPFLFAPNVAAVRHTRTELECVRLFSRLLFGNQASLS